MAQHLRALAVLELTVQISLAQNLQRFPHVCFGSFGLTGMSHHTWIKKQALTVQRWKLHSLFLKFW